MIFEQIATGGCHSYLVGCADTCAAVLIDPEMSQIDRYLALTARDGLRIRFVVDTHTHADHFSATRQLARQLPRGQLELRVNQELPDPTRRILTCCELGRISTLAAATLREIGFARALALDGGMQAWRAAGYPVKSGSEP
jgi:rhodanese-related sulfurtransferase